MKKTDWRSVFLEMWEYKGEGETSVMGDGASDFLDFIEQTRIEAQIEVLEELLGDASNFNPIPAIQIRAGRWVTNKIKALKQK